MSDTIVIGFGNTLRGDDGAGVRGAELIRDAFPEVDVVSVQELQPELAETVSHYRSIVFIDASAGNSGLSCVDVEADANGMPDGSHSLSPATVLALSKSLYGHTPDRAAVVGIPATQFEFGETLSPTTASMLQECVDVVGRMLCRVDMDAFDTTGS